LHEDQFTRSKVSTCRQTRHRAKFIEPQLCQHIAVTPASIARRRSQNSKPRDKLDYIINPDFINYVKIVVDT